MAISNDDAKFNEASVVKPSKFRRILPQFIATTIKNLHMIDWGLTVGVTSIIIPSLTGIPNAQNQGEFLSISSK